MLGVEELRARRLGRFLNMFSFLGQHPVDLKSCNYMTRRTISVSNRLLPRLGFLGVGRNQILRLTRLGEPRQAPDVPLERVIGASVKTC